MSRRFKQLCVAARNGSAHSDGPIRVNDVFGVLAIGGLGLASAEPLMKPGHFAPAENFHRGRFDAGVAKVRSKKFADRHAFLHVPKNEVHPGSEVVEISKEVRNKIGLTEEAPPMFFRNIRKNPKNPTQYERGEVMLSDLVNEEGRLGATSRPIHETTGQPLSLWRTALSSGVNNVAYGTGFGFGKGELLFGAEKFDLQANNGAKLKAAAAAGVEATPAMVAAAREMFEDNRFDPDDYLDAYENYHGLGNSFEDYAENFGPNRAAVHRIERPEPDIGMSLKKSNFVSLMRAQRQGKVKMSKRKMAEHVGVSESTIKRWEKDPQVIAMVNL